jgi:hypothetical protein
VTTPHRLSIPTADNVGLQQNGNEILKYSVKENFSLCRVWTGKNRQKSGNACYHSVQNLSSSLLSTNIKIKIYRTIILTVVLYGCDTSPLTFSEECRLRVFKNRVLRRISVPKRDEVTGEWGRLHNKNQVLFG